jgi:hypothetical protein
MRARLLLWAALGLNVLLAVMLVLLSRDSVQSYAPDGTRAKPAVADARQIKTNVVVRRQGFTWAEVESIDFAAYIANLRRIGCPEKTIRDIIVAEVNDLFAERMAREINLPEQKWWLPEPDMDALESGMDQLRTLEQEKAILLTQLLGVGWDAQRTMAGGNAIRFDGAVLSKLSPDTKSAVEQIESSARRARAETEERARQDGRVADPAEFVELRQETRRQLAAILSPEQLEEYLLRYSQTADQMRDDLRGYSADADEFRRIFRARDSFDQQIAALNPADSGTAVRRAELERARDEALRQSIGPERFAFYQLSQSPAFRHAQEQAEQSGAPPEKVVPIYRINQVVQQEVARIQSDQTLSDDQKRVALAAVSQQQQNSIDRILTSEGADTVAAAVNEPAIPAPPPLPDLPPAVFDSGRNPRGPVFNQIETKENAALAPSPVITADTINAGSASRGPIFDRSQSKSGRLPATVTEAPRGVDTPPSPKGPIFDRIP